MAVEKELINGINLMIQGNEAGFNILYSYTYNYVYGRAKVIMKDEQDALDLTQETFIQAYKGIQSLDNVNNIYAWLGSIVYRNGMKIYRKKRDILVNEDAEDIFENVISEDKDFRPEVTAEEQATSNIIMEMIEELPELQKAAIFAYYYDNMKIDEIAELFDCSSNTIKSRLNYAKKFLKDKVEMHEKKYAYKLHSLSPAVIILALRSLLSGKAYAMSAGAAQTVYNFACAGIGFAPSTVVSIGEAGATYAKFAFQAAENVGATAASTASTATVAKVGMTIGAKITLGLATAATVGAIGIGGIHMVNNGDLASLFQVEEAEDKRENETPNVKPEGDPIHMDEEMEDWENLEGVYLYSPDGFEVEGGGFKITISNVQGASKAEDVSFDVLFETYAELYETGHSVKVNGRAEGFVDGIATMSGTTEDGVLWEVEMNFFKDGNAVLCKATKTENGKSVTQGYHDPNIAIKTCEEMKDVRNLFDEGDTTFVGTSDSGITYQLVITEAETLYSTDGITGRERAWQVPTWRLTITYGDQVLEYSDNDDFEGLVCTFFTQVFDYQSDFMGYYILLEDGNLLFSVDALREEFEDFSCEEPITLYKQ